MPSLVSLIKFEEGWRARPYICKLGYPTVGYGFKLGPKGADIKLYDFLLPKSAGDMWLIEFLDETLEEMMTHPALQAALAACAGCEARIAVLISMAYQMGVPKLLDFKKALQAITDKDWDTARKQMLASLWASEKQTPARAQRHAMQMQSGTWFAGYE
uniref:Glycoside hydrolase n=1 Tax=viral metagenome TaxID=1070528 RepID=A0A6M3J3U0_9ZZZZ